MKHTFAYDSPVGMLLITTDGEAVTQLDIRTSDTPLPFPEGDEAAKMAVEWLDAYFAGRELPLPALKTEGTEYRKRIWECLLEIPYGEVCSYKDIACRYTEKTGKHTSPRAVGGAVGTNPISIMIPCHRVIGSDGSLTGFGWGTDVKTRLLTGEGRMIENDKVTD